MTHRKLIEQMLDCIDELKYSNDTLTAQRKSTEAVAAAREYLAQPEQSEPVCETGSPGRRIFKWFKRVPQGTLLYAAAESPQPKALEPLTDEEIRAEFSKLYPNDIGILELAENNRDYAVEAIGARHHWAAFLAGARAVLAAQGAKQ